MGMLVEGKWTDKWYDTKSTGGRFKRQESTFRNWIRADGSTDFQPESGRYHLYVSLACPWAHRTLIYRRLKGLEEHITISVVNPFMLENGWTFEEGNGVIPDTVNGAEYLHQIYTAAKAGYTGRVTVPVLWDRSHRTIVSNGHKPSFRPLSLVDEIDPLNDRIYTGFNNGVYKAGFATSQESYNEEVTRIFEVLDEMEEILTTNRYLTGDQVTEADWRFLPTLLRFDPVYVGHFKCNLRRIADYPNIHNYMVDLMKTYDLADTFNLEHVKNHYYGSHPTINPTLIVPYGPEVKVDLFSPL
jgi:putative glutathione S-transferase